MDLQVDFGSEAGALRFGGCGYLSFKGIKLGIKFQELGCRAKVSGLLAEQVRFTKLGDCEFNGLGLGSIVEGIRFFFGFET